MTHSSGWHGKVQPDKFDRMFRFMSYPNFANSEFGDVEAPCGAIATITHKGSGSQLAVELVSAGYNFIADEARDCHLLLAGTYVTVVDSNGLIWCFFYPADDAEMQRFLIEDLKHATAEYNQWLSADETDI